MRFISIELKNYRCFDSALFCFTESGQKTINIVEGENGSGKTELLFAFEWALYGFDFASLKNKSKNNYSLNSKLYYKLQNTSDPTNRESAYVKLNIENEGIKYTIETTEVFLYKNGKIKSNIFRILTFQNDIKETKILKQNGKDSIEFNTKLNNLIPAKVLNGLIFDGEKMKNLTSLDDTNKSVEGIIEKITSASSIDNLKTTYHDLLLESRSQLKKISNMNGDRLQEQNINTNIKLINEIEKLKKEIEEDGTKLALLLEEKKIIDIKYAGFKDNDTKINDRLQIEEQIKGKKELLSIYQQNLSTNISEKGFLLLSKGLFNSTKTILEESKIPKGLSSEAVLNIIEQGICICGEKLTEKQILILKELSNKLPPININSTISEMVSMLETERIETEQIVLDLLNKVTETKKEIGLLSKQKDNISNEIIQNYDGTEKINLEKRNKEVNEEIGKFKFTQNENYMVLTHKQKENETLEKEIAEQKDKNETTKLLNEKNDFCKNAETLIDIWKEENIKRALNNINNKLANSFEILSEDYKRQRRIIITKHGAGKNKPYRILVYYEKQLQEKLLDMRTSGEYKRLYDTNHSEEEIKERAIIEISDTNSQGQAEINTLAFVKSIMEYASEEKNQGLEITKYYPLIIDSPFGHLSGENLLNVASKLNSFSNQVILMVSPSRLNEVKDSIISKSSTHYKLIKSKVDNATTVKGEII